MPAISRSVALAALAGLALAACTGGGRSVSSAKGRVATTSTSSTSASGPAVKAVRSMDELSKALDLTVPDGYTLQPDNVDDTGPSDLDKAVSDDGGGDARDVLVRDGFVRGYQREWSLQGGVAGGSGSSAGNQILSFVYQFANHPGAADYTARVTANDGGRGGAPLGGFTVPDIDGAVGVNGTDPNFPTSSVTFAKGPYSVQIVVNGPEQAGLQSLAASIADEQYARL